MTKQQRKELQEATDEYRGKYFSSRKDYCKVIEVGFFTEGNCILIECIVVGDGNISHNDREIDSFKFAYKPLESSKEDFMKAYRNAHDFVKYQNEIINKYGSKI